MRMFASRWPKVMAATVVASGLVLAAGLAQAVGEAQPPKLTVKKVADVLSERAHDQAVTVRGKIVEHLGGNEFVMEDASGKIILDGGPPKRTKLELTVGDVVEVSGLVDLGRDRNKVAEIDVTAVGPADDGDSPDDGTQDDYHF